MNSLINYRKLYIIYRERAYIPYINKKSFEKLCWYLKNSSNRWGSKAQANTIKVVLPENRVLNMV